MWEFIKRLFNLEKEKKQKDLRHWHNCQHCEDNYVCDKEFCCPNGSDLSWTYLTCDTCSEDGAV